MAHKRQMGLGGQLCAQHLTQGLTWGKGTNEVSPARPPLTPLGLCTCLWMPFSHCFFWLTPPWLRVSLSGSLPGFLSHSRFTNHLLSVPRASPRSAFSWCVFITHCLPFLVGLGEEQSQGLLQDLASRWIHTSETTPPPASPTDARLVGCVLEGVTVHGTQGQREESSVKGVSFLMSVPPRERQVLTEGSASWEGRSWEKPPPSCWGVLRLGGRLRPGLCHHLPPNPEQSPAEIPAGPQRHPTE